jgi:hypothetical protein
MVDEILAKKFVKFKFAFLYLEAIAIGKECIFALDAGVDSHHYFLAIYLRIFNCIKAGDWYRFEE